METFEQDVKYVLKKTNLVEKKIPFDLARGKRLETATLMKKSDEKLNEDGLVIANNRTMEYLNNLNKNLIQDLYRIFKPDFDMFRYSIKEFV